LVYTAQTYSLAPDIYSESSRNAFTGKAKRGNPIGAFGAAWDDMGPHSELYWLGWSAVAAFSWNNYNPRFVEEFTAEFMTDFYGPKVRGMVDVYQDMNRLSNFWNRSWDKVVNDVPGKGDTRASYGNSAGKYAHPRPLSKSTLPSPVLPSTPVLNVRPVYASGKYKELVDEAKKMDQLATSVIYRIEENLSRAENNRYNLRVLLALTRYLRHHARLFIQMDDMENNLQTAEQKAAVGDAKSAVEALLFAIRVGKNNIYEREKVFNNMKAVFAETRVPGYLTREERYFGQEPIIIFKHYIKITLFSLKSKFFIDFISRKI